jgi:hypothetical protein
MRVAPFFFSTHSQAKFAQKTAALRIRAEGHRSGLIHSGTLLRTVGHRGACHQLNHAWPTSPSAASRECYSTDLGASMPIVSHGPSPTDQTCNDL